jgi:hypothetical protein
MRHTRYSVWQAGIHAVARTGQAVTLRFAVPRSGFEGGYFSQEPSAASETCASEVHVSIAYRGAAPSCPVA